MYPVVVDFEVWRKNRRWYLSMHISPGQLPSSYLGLLVDRLFTNFVWLVKTKKRRSDPAMTVQIAGDSFAIWVGSSISRCRQLESTSILSSSYGFYFTEPLNRYGLMATVRLWVIPTDQSRCRLRCCRDYSKPLYRANLQ